MNFQDILTHLAAFLGGLGAGFSLKIALSNRNSSSRKTNKVTQRGNFVGGDMSGGDMNKKDRP